MDLSQAVKLERCIIFTSYPRSGSNWIRAVLVSSLDKAGVGDDLIKSFGRPGPFHNIEFRDQPVPIVKTHFHSGRFSEICSEIVAVITIRRHPLDVMLSSLNFLYSKGTAVYFRGRQLRSVDEIISGGEMDYYIDKFCADDGISYFSGMCGKYSDYHRGVRALQKDVPTLDISYEDFYRNPSNGREELLRFLSSGRAIDSKSDREIAETSAGGASLGRSAFTYKRLLTAEQIGRFYSRYEGYLGVTEYCDRQMETSDS